MCGTWSRAISGKYDSVRWIRNASSSGGCCAEQRVAVVVDDRDRVEIERHRRRGSVLEEVLVELERLVLLGVGGGLGPADLEVLRREARSPSAPIRTSSRSSSSSASAAVSGKRRMPRCSRSSSVRLPGSSLTGSPGSSPRSMPSRAAAMTPPSEMYGLALASLALSSRLVEPASSSQ